MCNILTCTYPYSRWIGNPSVFCYFVWTTEDEASWKVGDASHFDIGQFIATSESCVIPSP